MRGCNVFFAMILISGIAAVVLGFPAIGILMVLVAVLALAGEKKGGCSDTLATILLIAALAVIVGVVIQIGGLPWEAF